MVERLQDRPPEEDPSPRTTLVLRVVWVLWVIGLFAFLFWAASFMWPGDAR